MRRRGRRGDEVEAELADAQAELDVRRREIERMSSALDGLPIGVILVDSRGRVQVRNAAADRLGGAAHSDVLVRAAVDENVSRAVTGTESASTVELFGPPRRVLHVRALPLPTGGAVVAIDDISERARLDAVRTDFVANISHELKTPVGALAVLAETIAGEDDLAVVQRLATKAADEAHRAAAAIDELLELSRIELAGRAVRERVVLSDVVDDAVVRVGALAEQRGIVVHTEGAAAETTEVLGDRRQLASAIGNLLENAVKYSERGGEVWLSSTIRGSDGCVDVTVRDRGIGIPARDHDRIFERFYRVDRARSRDTGGTGLGLAIVRHVATNHGGEVHVESVEGEGSTFTLSIPAAP
jgi:two-component system sensor histidine kinase SenX3